MSDEVIPAKVFLLAVNEKVKATSDLAVRSNGTLLDCQALDISAGLLQGLIKLRDSGVPVTKSNVIDAFDKALGQGHLSDTVKKFTLGMNEFAALQP